MGLPSQNGIDATVVCFCDHRCVAICLWNVDGIARFIGYSQDADLPTGSAGGTDCGINNEMSGWPTTTVPGPTVYSCLRDALSSGRPARLVVIRPSNVDSGRTTSDGYSIPAGIVITYRVLGPNRLQVTTDRHEAGGPVTTQNCTGMSQLISGSPPIASGCQ